MLGILQVCISSCVLIMKLFKSLHLGLTLFVGAFILSRGCSAADHDSEAGPSNWQPSAPAERDRFLDPYPRAEEYIRLLDGERIAQLSPSEQRHPNAGIYVSIPFYAKRPLFPIQADPRIVEQALRDFRSVAILDLRRNDARHIIYGNTRLAQAFLPGMARALAYYRLNPDLHTLHKWAQMPQSLPLRNVPTVSLDDIPHAYRMPILETGTDSLAHMKTATSTGRGKFWYRQSDDILILVNPFTDSLFVHANVRETDEVARILMAHATAERQYGQHLASILWGAPIYPVESFRQERMQHTPLAEYPRFAANAGRQQMIQALQTRGRFRIYMRDTDGNPIGYKVKLRNPQAEVTRAMDVSVEPLSRFEMLEEKAYALAGKLHLPSV